jgi:hypothetical protein
MASVATSWLPNPLAGDRDVFSERAVVCDIARVDVGGAKGFKSLDHATPRPPIVESGKSRASPRAMDPCLPMATSAAEFAGNPLQSLVDLYALPLLMRSHAIERLQ